MERQIIQTLIKQCGLGLFDLACAVSGHPHWDLSIPVGVIDARRTRPKLIVTSIGTINSIVKASSTIGDGLRSLLQMPHRKVLLCNKMLKPGPDENGEVPMA